MQGRTDGYASSVKAELMGLLAAILSAPPDQNIIVELDNQAVVQEYQQLVHSRADTLPRKRLRSTYSGLWAALHKIVRDRPGTVDVVWVRGHSTNTGNNLADMVATSAVRVESTPWSVDLSEQQDNSLFAYCHDNIIEHDLRQLLKHQTTIRRRQTWTAQRRVKRAISDLDDIEWRSTFALVHDRRSVHTFYSNAADTRRRTHHIKKLHDMLPTMNSMKARHPDIYSDRVYCVCDIQDEDNDHLWTCSANGDVCKQIWHDGLQQIDKWSRAETAAYNKKSKKQHEYDIACNKAHAAAPKPIVWVCPKTSTHIQGLSCIGGTQSLLLGDDFIDRSPDLTWRISDLYRDITPISLIKEW
ncbi:hypothetical protein BGZ54_004513, partial [Gamsiella multidivaricata]